MATIPSTVIGIDLGRYALKAVLMQRRGGNRLVLHSYALRPLTRELDSPEKLAAELRALFGELRGSTRACVVADSCSDAILRIIEQPQTPPEILRDAVRLNGMFLLNQDVKDFVIDCDQAGVPGRRSAVPLAAQQGGPQFRYVIAGLPRRRVTDLDAVFSGLKAGLRMIQLAPVAVYNAFEFGHEQTFNEEAFMLVDIGHRSSTVLVGVKGELVLVRVLEYGGNLLLESLLAHGADSPSTALAALERGNDSAVSAARASLATLTREISSSIGFFEGRSEENIPRIYISGGLAQSRPVVQILAEELHLPCMAWSPFEKCEIALPDARKAAFRTDVVNLHAACGAAISLLKAS